MAKGRKVFVLDVGTSALKAGIIDENGEALWLERARMMRKEADLELWYAESWVTAFREVLGKMPRLDIDAIAVSGNGPTMVPMDAQGEASAPVLLWIDRNSEPNPDCPSFYLPKVNWFRKHRPQAFARTQFFISCPEYLSFLLTGQACTVLPHADFQPFLWDHDQLETYGLESSLFPEFVRPGQEIGRITKEAGQAFGLPQGIPVYAAGSDFMMSLLGTGCIRPGMICDRAGTSEGINYCSERKVKDLHLRTLPHALPGLFNVAGILSSTGRMFEWFRTFSGQKEIGYESMIRNIIKAFPDTELPFFLPSIHADECYEFVSAVFVGLRPRHGAAEMGVAVLESIGFTIRQVLSTMERAGLPIGTIRACGGQAKNQLWTQVKADMLGRRIEVPKIADAELLGCAIHAYLGLGHYSSLEEAVSELVRIETCYEPEPQAMLRHTARFQAYQTVHQKLGASGLGKTLAADFLV